MLVPVSVAVTVTGELSLSSTKTLLIVSFFSGSWFISASVIVTVTSLDAVTVDDDVLIVPAVSWTVSVNDVAL